MRIRLILVAAFALFLSGCAAMFNSGDLVSCKSDGGADNGGDGVPCVSVRNAYQLSNNNSQFSGNYRNAGAASNAIAAISDGPVASVSVSLPQPVQQPMPVMEPAKVMRVWINNWTDSAGDLHYPSYVFTEVTPRRWAVGANANRGASARIVTPYRIEGDSSQQAALVTAPPMGAQQQAAASALNMPPPPSLQTPLQMPTR
jgi:conjugal transfer pilus assembly protein TraV